MVLEERDTALFWYSSGCREKPAWVARLPWRHAKHCGKVQWAGPTCPEMRKVFPDEEAFQPRPRGLEWGKGEGGKVMCLRDPESGSISRTLRRPV